MEDFSKKKCVPCEGIGGPLPKEKADEYLNAVRGGWVFKDDKTIRRDIKFKNFKTAIAFINKVADLAEEENHHPDIFLTNWNRAAFELSTHAIGGLSENDFVMAAKINSMKHES